MGISLEHNITLVDETDLHSTNIPLEYKARGDEKPSKDELEPEMRRGESRDTTYSSPDNLRLETEKNSGTHEEDIEPENRNREKKIESETMAYQDAKDNKESDQKNKSDQEPEFETETDVEQETEELFDIGYWISFAKGYAFDLGLHVTSDASACWDNPITAGSHCKYLERDIAGRLERYANDPSITDVWIWAEELSDGNYEIYIGYA